MPPRRLVPVALAFAGLVAVVIGVHQELVHVAPGFEGTITTGWGGDRNHEERLLARLALVGGVGAVAASRWRRFAAVPVATGVAVLFYALRATLHYALDPGLYVTVSAYGGPTGLVLGAEPVLLVGGGGLLVAADVVRWRAHPDRADGDLSSVPSVR
jgi:hypothetical protein